MAMGTDKTFSMTWRSVARSLYTGMTTDSFIARENPSLGNSSKVKFGIEGKI
jgi:hypothetical protein